MHCRKKRTHIGIYNTLLIDKDTNLYITAFKIFLLFSILFLLISTVWVLFAFGYDYNTTENIDFTFTNNTLEYDIDSETTTDLWNTRQERRLINYTATYSFDNVELGTLPDNEFGTFIDQSDEPNGYSYIVSGFKDHSTVWKTHGDANGDNGYGASVFPFEITGDIEFWIASSDTTRNNQFGVRAHAPGNPYTNTAVIGFYNDQFYWYDGGYNNLLAVDDDTWYHVLLHNFNFTTETYNITIDNTDYGSADFNNLWAVDYNIGINILCQENYDYECYIDALGFDGIYDYSTGDNIQPNEYFLNNILTLKNNTVYDDISDSPNFATFENETIILNTTNDISGDYADMRFNLFTNYTNLLTLNYTFTLQNFTDSQSGTNVIFRFYYQATAVRFDIRYDGAYDLFGYNDTIATEIESDLSLNTAYELKIEIDPKNQISYLYLDSVYKGSFGFYYYTTAIQNLLFSMINVNGTTKIEMNSIVYDNYETDKFEFTFNSSGNLYTENSQLENDDWIISEQNGNLEIESQGFDKILNFITDTDNSNVSLKREITTTSNDYVEIDYSFEQIGKLTTGAERIMIDLFDSDYNSLSKIYIIATSSYNNIYIKNDSDYIDAFSITSSFLLNMEYIIYDNELTIIYNNTHSYTYEITTDVQYIQFTKYVPTGFGVSNHDTYLDSVGIYINAISQSIEQTNSGYVDLEIENYDLRSYYSYTLQPNTDYTNDFELYLQNDILLYNDTLLFDTNIIEYNTTIYDNGYLFVNSESDYRFTFQIHTINIKDSIDNELHIGTLTFDDDTYLSYFTISSEKLYFTFDANQTYAKMSFDIPNVNALYRKMSVGGLKSSDTYVYQLARYSDNSYNERQLELSYSSRPIVLHTDKTIDKIEFFVNGSFDCTGYYNSFSLDYIPSLDTSITISNLLTVIIPLLILIIPSTVISLKFGKLGFIVMFLLMTIITYIGNMIPTWLFFIILLGCGFFLFVEFTRNGDLFD